MEHSKLGTMWSSNLHGFCIFELVEDEYARKKWVSETGSSLKELAQNLRKRTDVKMKLPKLKLNLVTPSDKSYYVHKVISATPLEVGRDHTVSTQQIFMNPTSFVKDYVKGQLAKPGTPPIKERLVFCSQAPLNSAMTGKQNIGKRSYGYAIKITKKVEPGLPPYIQLATVRKSTPPPRVNKDTGIEFENLLCGSGSTPMIQTCLNSNSKCAQGNKPKSESGQKTRFLYSIHSFTYKKFRFFYSSEIDGVEKSKTKNGANVQCKYETIELKTWHPQYGNDNLNLYRFKLKEAFVKVALSRIPKLLMGIETAQEIIRDLTPAPTAIYDEYILYNRVEIIPELCRKNLSHPLDKHQWNLRTLEDNFARFVSQLDQNWNTISTRNPSYCNGYLKSNGFVYAEFQK